MVKSFVKTSDADMDRKVAAAVAGGADVIDLADRKSVV